MFLSYKYSWTIRMTIPPPRPVVSPYDRHFLCLILTGIVYCRFCLKELIKISIVFSSSHIHLPPNIISSYPMVASLSSCLNFWSIARNFWDYPPHGYYGYSIQWNRLLNFIVSFVCIPYNSWNL